MSLKNKNGETVVFHRGRTKDLVRLLLEADGAALTKEELCGKLFDTSPEFLEKNLNYFFQLVGDLSSGLALHGADMLLLRSADGYALDMEKIELGSY